MWITVKYHAIKRYRHRIDRGATERQAWGRIVRAVRTGLWVWRGPNERLVVCGRVRLIMVGNAVITCWRQTGPILDNRRRNYR